MADLKLADLLAELADLDAWKLSDPWAAGFYRDPEMEEKMDIEKVVVTRHPALVALLVERGVITEDTPTIGHVTPELIAGKHVIGVLPMHLAAHAALISEVQMQLTVDDRQAMQRGDLSLERTREVAGELITYRVTRV